MVVAPLRVTLYKLFYPTIKTKFLRNYFRLLLVMKETGLGKTAPNLSRQRLLIVLLLACMVIDIFCYRGSQFDSGIFSDAGQSDQLVLHNSVSMLERLDSLETKLSSFSSKVGSFSPSRKDDKAGMIESMEDLEMKQLLFRKLTTFRKKRVQI